MVVSTATTNYNEPHDKPPATEGHSAIEGLSRQDY